MKKQIFKIFIILISSVNLYSQCNVIKYDFNIDNLNIYEKVIIFGDNNKTIKEEFLKKINKEIGFKRKLLSRSKYKSYLALKTINVFSKEDLNHFFSKIKDSDNKVIYNVLEHKYYLGNWKRFIYNQKRFGCSLKLRDEDTMRVAAGLYSYFEKTHDKDAYMIANSIGLNFWFNWFKIHSKNPDERLDSYNILYKKYNIYKDKYIKELFNYCEKNITDRGFYEALTLFNLKPTAKSSRLLKEQTTVIVNHLLNIGDYKSARKLKKIINKLVLLKLKI